MGTIVGSMSQMCKWGAGHIKKRRDFAAIADYRGDVSNRFGTDIIDLGISCV
jgi:hypothetical protein